jgi:hypothetical protein
MAARHTRSTSAKHIRIQRRPEPIIRPHCEMAGDDPPLSRDWDGVLSCLSNTIQFKSRADALNWREAFENMKVYLQAGG